MKLKPMGPNKTLLITGEGNEYFFSYETLVAGYDPDSIDDPESENGYWFVGEAYSATTTRHIKSYLENLYTSEKTTKVTKSDAALAESVMM